MENQTRTSDRKVIVVMGTTGSGKTTIASLLAHKLHAKFIEGDSYHSESNKEKMSNDIPLTDDDRWPWLDSLRQAMEHSQEAILVVSCSSLKKIYRDKFYGSNNFQVALVYLDGSLELLQERVSKRKNHFAKSDLVQSQFDILEIPDPKYEKVIKVGVDRPIEEIVDIAYNKLLENKYI